MAPLHQRPLWMDITLSKDLDFNETEHPYRSFITDLSVFPIFDNTQHADLMNVSLEVKTITRCMHTFIPAYWLQLIFLRQHSHLYFPDLHVYH